MAWEALVGSSFLFLVRCTQIFGSFLIWGNICVYVTSYLRLYDPTVNLDDTMVTLPVMLLAVSLVSYTGSTLAAKYGVRLMASIGTSLCVLGVGLSGFCTSLYTFTFCFGVLFGLGTGLSYMVPFMVSWGHYPNSRARVTGLLMAAFGYSTTIFNLVTTAIVNPDNEVATLTETNGMVVSHYFREEIARRTPMMLFALAGIYAVLAALGVLMISETGPKPAQAPPKVVISCGDLTTSAFLILYFASFLSIGLSMYVSSAYKIYGDLIFRDDKYLAVVGSVSALVNGTSRFLWAEAMEAWGFKKVYIGLLVTQILTSVTLYPLARTELLYMLYMCAIFINQGCHFVIFPALMVKMYGRMKGALLYSILYSEFGLSALAGFVIQKYYIKDIGYEVVYQILTAAAVVSLVLMVPFQELKDEATGLTQPLLTADKAE